MRKWTDEDQKTYTDLQQQINAREAKIAEIQNTQSAAMALAREEFKSKNPDYDAEVMIHAVEISKIRAQMANIRKIE